MKQLQSTSRNNFSPALLSNSGRFDFDTINSWATDSDDEYGSNQFIFSEKAGTAATPALNFKHNGFLIPKGRMIKGISISGRFNNAEVTDAELYLVLKTPNPLSGWVGGINADGEFSAIVLHNDLFKVPTGGGVALGGLSTDLVARRIPLDVQATDMSYLSIYARPVGTLTALRYMRCAYTWEIA